MTITGCLSDSRNAVGAEASYSMPMRLSKTINLYIGDKWLVRHCKFELCSRCPKGVEPTGKFSAYRQVQCGNADSMVLVPQGEPPITGVALVTKCEFLASFLLGSYFESEPQFLVELRTEPGLDADHISANIQSKRLSQCLASLGR